MDQISLDLQRISIGKKDQFYKCNNICKTNLSCGERIIKIH